VAIAHTADFPAPFQPASVVSPSTPRPATRGPVISTPIDGASRSTSIPTFRIMMSPSMLASLLGPVQDPTLGITPSTHRTIHALHLFAFIQPFWKLTVLVIVTAVSQIRLVIHLQSYHRPLGHSLAMSTTPRHDPSKFPTCSPANILLSPYNVPFKSSLNESYDFQRLAKAFITSPPSPFPAITNNPNQ
jgi:hypothetical protein